MITSELDMGEEIATIPDYDDGAADGTARREKIGR